MQHLNISILIFNISLNLADCYRNILVALYFTVRVLTCTNSIFTCGSTAWYEVTDMGLVSSYYLIILSTLRFLFLLESESTAFASEL